MTRILIADDQELIRNHLKLFLEQRGWDVCAEAQNGQEAIQQAAQHAPDVVILDLSMPVVDGLQAAREIARLLRGVAILIFTVDDSPEVQRRAKAAGAHRVVAKAEGVAALARAVEALVTPTPLPT